MRMQMVVQQSTPFNMPRKKKETVPELRLTFTGKMSILIEQENYGPLEYRINDLDTVMKVLRLLLDEAGKTTPVDSYNARTQKTFTKILNDID
jgi:ribosomal protein L30/L7E